MLKETEKELIAKAMSILGSKTSPAKTRAARKNAKLGGWPKGRKRGNSKPTHTQ